jgi:hypothetical protein
MSEYTINPTGDPEIDADLERIAKESASLELREAAPDNETGEGKPHNTRCEERAIASPTGRFFRQCRRGANHHYEGSWYCWQHYPPYQRKQTRLYDDKWAEERKRFNKIAAFFEGVATEDIPAMYGWRDLNAILGAELIRLTSRLGAP